MFSLKRVVTVFGMSSFLVCVNGLSQAPSPQNVQAFSGRWEGRKAMSQRGASCTYSGGPTPYAVVLTINDDRSFIGELLFTEGARKGQKNLSETWMGEILPDLHVRLAAQKKSYCNGEEHTYSVIYSGQFSQKKGKYRLTLKGTDKTCPQMQCVFESILDLEQK